MSVALLANEKGPRPELLGLREAGVDVEAAKRTQRIRLCRPVSGARWRAEPGRQRPEGH